MSKSKILFKEYQNELDKCTELLDKYWPASTSCNGRLRVAGHLGVILMERDGIEAALKADRPCEYCEHSKHAMNDEHWKEYCCPCTNDVNNWEWKKEK